VVRLDFTIAGGPPADVISSAVQEWRERYPKESARFNTSDERAMYDFVDEYTQDYEDGPARQFFIFLGEDAALAVWNLVTEMAGRPPFAVPVEEEDNDD